MCDDGRLAGVELTLIANVALDRVDGGAWTCGGCPSFTGFAFARLGARGMIYSACAPEDRATFAGLGLFGHGITGEFIDAERTSRFTLDYRGEFGQERVMSMGAIGHSWSVADVDGLVIETEWIHLAPLARSDFPVATVARLVELGHRVSYDGQGLVRAPVAGPLTLDGDFDRELLRYLSALKLSEEELAVVVGERDPDEVMRELGVVPELLLTEDFRGVEVRTGAGRSRVAPPTVVSGVQATGAGDVFMVGYDVARGRGDGPVAAARCGADVAAAMLGERKNVSGTPQLDA